MSHAVAEASFRPVFLKGTEARHLGPMPHSEVKLMYEAGHFSSKTLVCENGLDWLPIGKAMMAPPPSSSPNASFVSHAVPIEASSAHVSSFVTADDAEDYQYEDDLAQHHHHPGGGKPRRATLLAAKSKLKTIGSSLKNTEKMMVRAMTGKARRVSLTGEFEALPSSSPVLQSATLAPALATGVASVQQQTAAAMAPLGPGMNPPHLWRSSSTPTATKRALKALTSMAMTVGQPQQPPSSPRGHSQEFTDDEDPGDVLSSVRALALALNQAVDHVDRLESSMRKSSASPARSTGGPSHRDVQLEAENGELKEQLRKLRGLVADRTPALLPDVDAIMGQAGNASEAPQPLPKPLPLEVDSPMLRERMGRTEMVLDELRQHLKHCIKSGQHFVQHNSTAEESKRNFAVDLTKSGSYLLEMVGQVFLSMREEHGRMMAYLESDFILPLASFANQDLKRANHQSADMERRREAFEAAEGRLMAQRRGKDSRPRQAFSTQSEESPDKLSYEALNAEASYELARIQLVKVLNDLNADSRIEVNKCTLAMASALHRFYSVGAAEASRLLHAAKAANDKNGEVLRAKEMWERAWQLRCAEIEARRQALRPVPRLPPRRQDAEPDLIHEGWLFKRSSNVIKDWKKRYFQVKAGQLIYFRGQQAETVADLLMWTVRDAPKSGVGAFEVVTAKRIVVLQASSEEDKEAWIAAIRNAKQRQFANLQSAGGVPVAAQEELVNLCSVDQSGQQDSDDEDMPAQVVDEQLRTPLDNYRTCADCLSGAQVAWVSLNLGVFLCIECCGVHRGLGTHVSKIRSVHMDTLSAVQVDILKRLGNVNANRIWEERSDLAQHQKGKEGFIASKYVGRAFVDLNAPVVLADLFKAAAADDIIKLAWFMAHNVSLDVRGPSMETALHFAALSGGAAGCEFLLLNGAKIDAVDAQARTPLDVARGASNLNAFKVLQQWTVTESAGSYSAKRVLVTETL